MCAERVSQLSQLMAAVSGNENYAGVRAKGSTNRTGAAAASFPWRDTSVDVPLSRQLLAAWPAGFYA
jgi:hypothetical protein